MFLGLEHKSFGIDFWNVIWKIQWKRLTSIWFTRRIYKINIMDMLDFKDNASILLSLLENSEWFKNIKNDARLKNVEKSYLNISLNYITLKIKT